MGTNNAGSEADLLDRLTEFRQVSEVCGARSNHFAGQFQRLEFPTDSVRADRRAKQIIDRCTPIAEALQATFEKWEALDKLGECLDRIKWARGRKLDPIAIGTQTFSTAHESAFFKAKLVWDIWCGAGGRDDIENCENIKRCLDAASLPPDLSGGIDVEYFSALDDLAGQSVKLGSGETALISPSETPTEKRDKWLYAEVLKGKAYGTLVRALTKKPVTWPRIDTEAGIRQAVLRYAKKHDLEAPPTRQPGRPKYKRAHT